MLFSRGRHCRSFTSSFSVITTHQALQFRKFIDHFRAQVSLGKLRRALSFIRVRTHDGGQLTRQSSDTFNPFCLRAKLVVEGHVGKRSRPRSHVGCRHPQVVFPKEFCVRQTREQDLLVTRKDRCAIIDGFAVGDGDKAFNLVRFGILYREKLLMFLHGGLQHFWRQA